MNIKNDNKSLSLILYIFSFLLVMEWIYPLKEVANTGNISWFIIFIALSFIFYLFNAPFIAVFVVKIVYIVFAIHSIFVDMPLLGHEWISVLLSDTFKNISLIFSRSWDQLSNEFRTLLFFILLWLISYLLRYWLLIKRNIFLFFVMTIVYITVLDTFTPYNSKMAILRTIVFGFILLGMLFFQRFVDKEKLPSSRRLMAKWMIPLSIMVAGSTIFALIAPKASPIWPDPVPFFKSYAGGDQKSGRGNRVGKIGYREDDSELGGPFIGDDTTVFTVVSESRQYWRIETKDFYTGKGWKTSEPPSTSSYTIQEKLPTSLNEGLEPISFEDLKNEKLYKSATIRMEKFSPDLVHTYGFTNILYDKAFPNETEDAKDAFLMNNATEKITAIQNNKPFSIGEYIITFQLQRYSIKKMSEINGENVQIDPRYTQLPENFPKRVKDLAKEITKDKTNWYDMTDAIVSYLQSGRYTYDQKNVAIPSKNKDYVDQFLFETLRGYCDNFSTSMVTMLRSLGIPSRWVKGYSSGNYQGAEGVGQNIYKVTNNNAHSWVEVFFPNVGWVPFEPTMGFRNNSIFNNDVETASTQAGSTDDKKEKDVIQKPKEDPSVDKEMTQSESFSFSNLLDKVTNYIRTHWLLITAIFIILAIVALWLYRKRSKWLPFFLIRKYRMKKDSETFSQAYLSLLKQLRRYGLKKETGQTLRDYANNIDTYFGTNTMRVLTEKYERMIYRGENSSADWEEVRELWENLIKRTTG